MEFIGGPVVKTPPDEHATLMILVSEARRLDLEALRRRVRCPAAYAAKRRAANAKWAELREDVRRLLAEGECAKTVRAILAGRYPFLGVLAGEDIERCRRANEALITRLNHAYFSPPVTPPSAESEAEEASSGGDGWVFCAAGNIINCHNAKPAAPRRGRRASSDEGSSDSAEAGGEPSPPPPQYMPAFGALTDSPGVAAALSAAAGGGGCAAALFPSTPEAPGGAGGHAGAATSPWGSSAADEPDDLADVLDDLLCPAGEDAPSNISFDFTSLASADPFSSVFPLPFHSPPAAPNFSFDSLDGSVGYERTDSNSSTHSVPISFTSSFDGVPAAGGAPFVSAWDRKAAAGGAAGSPDPSSSAESFGEASSLNTSLCGSPDDFFGIRSLLLAVDDAATA